jgi:hypothetical protein
MRFRLLEGCHVDNVPLEPGAEPQRGTPHPTKLYFRGAVFESEQNLLLLNSSGMTPKFAAITGTGEVTDAATLQDQGGQFKDVAPPMPSPQAKSMDPSLGSPPRNAAEYAAALERMNLKQLQDEAAAEEVSIPPNATKQQIIQLLKSQK